MSLGGPVNGALDQAVKNAADQGIKFSIAAGNSGMDADSYSPASAGDHENVFTTSAVDNAYQMPWWSNQVPGWSNQVHRWSSQVPRWSNQEPKRNNAVPQVEQSSALMEQSSAQAEQARGSDSFMVLSLERKKRLNPSSSIFHVEPEF